MSALECKDRSVAKMFCKTENCLVAYMHMASNGISTPNFQFLSLMTSSSFHQSLIMNGLYVLKGEKKRNESTDMCEFSMSCKFGRK